MTPIAQGLGSIEAFEADLRRALARTERVLTEFREGFTATLFAEIIEGGAYSPGTPVGATGRTKAAWVREDQAEVSALANPLPHLLVLEFGSSDQAPQGFIRLAVEAAPQIAQDVARRVLAEVA